SGTLSTQSHGRRGGWFPLGVIGCGTSAGLDHRPFSSTGIGMLISGAFYFRRTERTIVDVL
ncbi:MAG: hypothetical protein KJ638_08705, partial [Chloroflexi bacterium]|nr:hypothetical protein [Chloroflexota bacterium]